MTKLLLSCVILILSGCAATPQKPVDLQCDQLARYARGIATLKQAGVPYSMLDSFTLTPTVTTFPIKMIRDEVYSKDFETPADAYVAYYSVCIDVGYWSMR